MTMPPTERELGWYLRNALRSGAAAELLKPIADAAAALLGTAIPGNTIAELDAALAGLAGAPADAAPLERNARFATAEFDLSDAERDVLLLALRLRRSRHLARFCSAVQDVLRDPVRVIAVVLGRAPDQVHSCVAPGARLRICGLIDFDPDDCYDGGLAVSRVAAGAMFALHADRDAWRAALIGRPCGPGLPWPAFDHIGAVAALAARVLQAAATHGEAGVHILLAGPPGTGKTEFARALATRAGRRAVCCR